MDSYVTGTAIRQLREAKHMTQAELAEKLAVSAKAISKWMEMSSVKLSMRQDRPSSIVPCRVRSQVVP